MTFEEIYKELESLGTEQNRKLYQKHGASDILFGVSYANLSKLKKAVSSPEGKHGVNHELALKLWETNNIDAQILASNIAEPDKIGEAHIDNWVKEIQYYPLADAFSELVYASPLAMKKMLDWTFSDKEFVKRIGYNLLSHFAKFNTVFNNGFFEAYINIIETEIHSSPNRAKEGMNNCLIAIGSRNEALRKRVLQSAKKIGTVQVDHGDTSCQTFVIEDYLDKVYTRRNLVKQ